MLVRFIAGNFLSFSDNTEFNMLPGNFKRHKNHVTESQLPLLKAAALYGANGAGKSNLIKAIALLKSIVSDGMLSFTEEVAFRNSPINAPTHLEIEFAEADRTFIYGLEFFSDCIVEEWLYETTAGVDEMVFTRKLDDDGTSLTIPDAHLKTETDRLRKKLYEEELLNETTPFIYLLTKSKERIIEEVNICFEYLSRKLEVIFPDSRPAGFIRRIMNDARYSKFANELIVGFDTGIARLNIETIELEKFYGANEIDKVEDLKKKLDKLENGNSGSRGILLSSLHDDVIAAKEDGMYTIKKLVTYHSSDDKEIKFEISNESDGTRRLIEFIPAFYNILQSERTVIIDEIDRSIHPFLLKQVLRELLSETSVFKGQLIFTTHESNLLDFELFRQDEIWFVEKDKRGATKPYPLSDYDIRADLDWEKGYFNGRFGAIPFLGNLKSLNWAEYGEVAE